MIIDLHIKRKLNYRKTKLIMYFTCAVNNNSREKNEQ